MTAGSPTLVTGAAGKTGRAVIRALAGNGRPVRALAFRPEQEGTVRGAGAAAVVVGDMGDPAILEEAMSGVGAVYHICPNMSPREVEIGGLALECARAAGVPRFVYHSVLHPQTQKMPHHWQKLRVEEMLFESGLSWTIVQPAPYMQNLLAGWRQILEEGVYRIPYPVETRLGLVDLEDVAAVAVTLLGESGHDGAVYELVGTPALTQREVGQLMGDSLGRSVRVEEIPLAQWEAQARAVGLGSYRIETLRRMFTYYADFGLWGCPNALQWLLGRPPTDLTGFLRREIEASVE